MKNKSLIITVITILIIGAGTFFGGMKYQESKSPVGRFGNFGNRNSQFQQRTQDSRPVNGEIISQDDTSIIIKIQDGSTKIVILSDKTAINKTSTGAKSDIKTGELVTAFGTENSDGSFTAQTIAIGGMMFRGGFGTQSASPKP